VREVASGLRFPEGPVALSDGSVLVVEIARGTLSRVFPDGRVEVVAETGGGPNGAAVGPDGAVWICNNGGFEWHEVGGRLFSGNQPADYSGGSIQRVELATGSVETVYRECDDRLCAAPTIWSSTGRAGSGSPTTARPASASATAPGCSTHAATARRSARWSSPWRRRTASRSRPTGTGCTWPRP
jgi:hypothetical protein